MFRGDILETGRHHGKAELTCKDIHIETPGAVNNLPENNINILH